jgi:F-type H+-transporting ATPase subunit gamma
MSTQLTAYQKRINAISANQKITNAMKLIASVKLKKERNIYDANNEFSKDLYKMMSLVLVEYPDQTSHYCNNTNEDVTLYIVVTSNFGLCGAYNINAIKYAKSIIRKTDKLILIGKKGVTAFSKEGYDIVYTLENDETGYERSHAEEISKICMNLFNKNIVGKIIYIYTAFVNQFTYEITSIDLLPISFDMEGKKSSHSNGILIFEPSEDAIMDYLVPLYFDTIIYSRLIEAHVSEESSRRLAMEKATNNAQEIKDRLTLQLNKERQETITQEITEIVSGIQKEQR